jgi:hypothetical protein
LFSEVVTFIGLMIWMKLYKKNWEWHKTVTLLRYY